VGVITQRGFMKCATKKLLAVSEL